MPISTINNASFADTAVHGQRNLIINGAMNVAQRGTSSTSTNFQTVDRWSIQNSGGVTQSQEDLTSSDEPYNYGFRKTLKLLNTSNASTTSTFAQAFQSIEAQNVACSGWDYTSSSSYITVQFWVKSSLAGTYVSFLRANDGTLKSYSFEFTLVADTWKKVTHTVSGDSGLTINNDNGSGMSLFIVPYYGPDYTTSGHTDEAWQTYSGSDLSGDYAQNWKNSSNSTFYITGVQLEVGEQATPFEHRSYGDELRRCQRYYQTIDYYHDYGSTSSAGNVFYFTNMSFPVPMRATPTMVGASDWGSNTGDAYTRYTATVVNGWIMVSACATGCFMRGNHTNIYNKMVGRGKFDAEL